ncbi:hypothetical protein, partial [Microcoleus sp. herbarium14]|uniref:hypothetical protein n=1 Tax=Microcoleus sp. herbarium14 TaxID=3055439 RepID=UPI002FD510E1
HSVKSWKWRTERERESSIEFHKEESRSKKDLAICQRRKTPDKSRRLRPSFLLCSYFWILAFSEIAIELFDRPERVFYTVAEANLRDC